jgi:hypothetical protein
MGASAGSSRVKVVVLLLLTGSGARLVPVG